MRSPIRFIIHSDYLCPWCANAAVRWKALEGEVRDRIEIVWKSYLLRPQPRPEPVDDEDRERRREKFFRYAQSWQRPAAEEDAYPFREWSGEHDPPSHSVPPQRVAKAAALLGRLEFGRVHDALFRAYFREGRDISAEHTLRELWAEAGLPSEAYEASHAPELVAAINREHREALDFGVSGVPSVHVEGNDAVVVGAQPLASLRRWVERLEDRAAKAGAPMEIEAS